MLTYLGRMIVLRNISWINVKEEDTLKGVQFVDGSFWQLDEDEARELVNKIMMYDLPVFAGREDG